MSKLYFCKTLPLSLFGIIGLISPALAQPAPSARIQPEAIKESSGLVKSVQHEGVFWVINDSGDGPYIYAIDIEGTGLASSDRGIEVAGAENVDWEALAVDDSGNIIIGDCGNNLNTRQDLTLYWIAEPAPPTDHEAKVLQKVRFHYPSQDAFPPEKADYDCEAIFWADGKVHLLTKHRSDLSTTLYRLDSIDPDQSNAVTPLSSFNTLGPVTGADCSVDGARLAVLTYTGIWVFERRADSSDWFSGAVSWMPFLAGQTEAICWIDESHLLITSEQRDMYEVGLNELTKLRE